jgi:hypothetical protein
VERQNLFVPAEASLAAASVGRVVNYRAAIGPGAEDPTKGVSAAIEWLTACRSELGGGDIQILLPQVRVLDERPELQRFAALPHVIAGTKRNRNGFGAPIVLAAWPTSSDFAEVSSAPRVEALCLLPWDAPSMPSAWVNAWAFNSGAEVIGGATPGRHIPVTLDAVVRVALVEIARRGDFGTMGHGLAKSTIKVLSDAGYRLPPVEVEAFLIAHGLPARLAGEAREFAQRVTSGHTLRQPRVGVLRGDAVDRWRAESRKLKAID